MLAALAPKLVGPILLADSPLSYWAGVVGENPMRYLGGLLGGSWTASLNPAPVSTARSCRARVMRGSSAAGAEVRVGKCDGMRSNP